MRRPLQLPEISTIDAVLFDAGGVLLLPDAEAGRVALQALDCESQAADWHRAHYLTNLLVEQSEVPDWPAVRRAIAAAVGVAPERLEEAVPLIEQITVATPWIAVEGADRALQQLVDAGYLTAIVSNASGTVERQLEEAGICSVSAEGIPRVGIVVDSHHVGIEKPDPRIFQIALDALGVSPSRALYVGDTVRFDVSGATAAGLHPVHLDPFELCDAAHSHVSELAELVDLLVPR